jgi:hypothetical protein
MVHSLCSINPGTSISQIVKISNKQARSSASITNVTPQIQKANITRAVHKSRRAKQLITTLSDPNCCKTSALINFARTQRAILLLCIAEKEWVPPPLLARQKRVAPVVTNEGHQSGRRLHVCTHTHTEPRRK